MNGLLHRLAASAAGTAPLVRSDARLPYRATGPGWAEPIATAGWGAPSSTPAPQPDLEFAQTPHQRTARRQPPDVIVPAGSSDRPQLTDPVLLLPRPERVVAHGAAQPRPMQMVPSRVGPSRAHDADASAATNISSPSFEHVSTSTSTLAPPARDDATLRAPLRPYARSAEPVPLMPGIAQPATRPSPPLAASTPYTRLPVAQTAASEERTEVHVHIGRIDVTAMHDAAPSPRRRLPLQPPMSLDAYLEGRRRSGG